VNSLAVHSNSSVYATNAAHQIFHWDGHKWTQIDGAATQIAVGKDGTVACVNSGGQIFVRAGLHAPWQQISGAATQIAVHMKDAMACVNSAGNIFAWHNGNWHQAPGAANWITMPRGHQEVWVTHAPTQSVHRHKA